MGGGEFILSQSSRERRRAFKVGRLFLGTRSKNAAGGLKRYRLRRRGRGRKNREIEETRQHRSPEKGSRKLGERRKRRLSLTPQYLEKQIALTMDNYFLPRSKQRTKENAYAPAMLELTAHEAMTVGWERGIKNRSEEEDACGPTAGTSQ